MGPVRREAAAPRAPRHSEAGSTSHRRRPLARTSERCEGQEQGDPGTGTHGPSMRAFPPRGNGKTGAGLARDSHGTRGARGTARRLPGRAATTTMAVPGRRQRHPAPCVRLREGAGNGPARHVRRRRALSRRAGSRPRATPSPGRCETRSRICTIFRTSRPSPLAHQVPPDRRPEGPDAPRGVGAPGYVEHGEDAPAAPAFGARRPPARGGRSRPGRGPRRPARPPVRARRPSRIVGRRGAGSHAVAAVGPGRGHRLLTLRYVDGLSIEDVCAHFAISQSQYFRELRRALDALVSLLWGQWEHRRRSEGTPPVRRLPHRIRLQTAGADDRRAGSLPAPLDRFIGRDVAVAALERLLDRSRLVTLTGPGGTGKTRLALEVAHRVRPRFRAGAAFVPLELPHRLPPGGGRRGDGTRRPGAGRPARARAPHRVRGRPPAARCSWTTSSTSSAPPRS